MKNHRYRLLGCRKDPGDERDIPIGLVLPIIPIPKRIDYALKMTPVRDQGDEGTCVAFASVVGVKEYQDSKEYNKALQLSPRYVYHLCKESDGIPDEDGTYPRIAMKVLKNFGTPTENFWPYKPYQTDRPKKGASQNAKLYKIKGYGRIESILEMERSLMVNGPFLSGVKVFESWFSDKAQKSGKIPLPKKREQSQGGHAICIMGYDRPKKLFKFKNSWGKSWGDKGYGYLGYDYMRDFAMDSWTATDLIVSS